jgi:hypothetical protein
MSSVVPGISRVMARSLLAAHGSMSAVAAVAPRICVATPASVGCEPLDWPGRWTASTSHPAPEAPTQGGPLGVRPPRHWILTDPDGGAEPVLFDRRAISLRALRLVADGSQLVDVLSTRIGWPATDACRRG